MGLNTLFIIALLLFISPIITLSIIKSIKPDFFNTHKTILEVILVYIPISLGFLVLIYNLTDTVSDFIYSNLILATLACLSIILDKKIDKNHNLKIIFHYFIYIVLFFTIKEVNRHLILPISHNWILIVLILNIRQIFKQEYRSDKNNILAIIANVLAIITLIVMFNYFSEPLEGISKQEYIVKNYLLKEKGYKENDIVHLKRLSFPQESWKEKRVLVTIKTEDEKSYIFFYKNGSIIDIEELKK